MTVLQIAVPGPFMHGLDYLFDLKEHPPSPGTRVTVPLRGKDVTGIVLKSGVSAQIPRDRLSPIKAVIDPQAALTPPLFKLGLWIHQYYHFPLGETLLTMLPPQLRRDKPLEKTFPCWTLTERGQNAIETTAKKAPRQHELLLILRTAGENGQFQHELPENSSAILRTLLEKGWVSRTERSFTVCIPESHQYTPIPAPYPLTAAQLHALDAIEEHLAHFRCLVLEGVTGSGKTEVYIQAIQKCLQAGKQALLLVPEISLTRQLIAQFKQRFPNLVAVSHSGMTDALRLENWIAMRTQQKSIMIGTRSAIFTPLKSPGIFIIDEEHDISYKQQDGLRYHARDVAIMRAKYESIPVVLGSATLSGETIVNMTRQHYQYLSLPHRISTAPAPIIRMVDMNRQAIRSGLSQVLINAIREHLANAHQVLLFLNQRGYAPVLFCQHCQWKAECPSCSANMVLHKKQGRLICHHCGRQEKLPQKCPNCQLEGLLPVGQGTERLEETLQHLFPDSEIIRIDRDSTRHRGRLDELLESVQSGENQILLGTQMLSKGHHFPNVSLSVILNADQGLFSPDFRATERVLQLITQVSGRAGRGEKPGEIILQSWHPDHPVLQTLIQRGYREGLQNCLQERQHAGLPPYAALILIRAEARRRVIAESFLQQVAEICDQDLSHENGLQILGPAPALMEKRAGYFSAQLMLRSNQRRILQKTMQGLYPKLSKIPNARKVRWSIDVDPVSFG
ncbi:MAG: primosomal protein N' [Gammaproteobacteria bacterium]|nr:MAG: primosomal protein N' [Gammaproteobacteria bacterium]